MLYRRPTAACRRASTSRMIVPRSPPPPASSYERLPDGGVRVHGRGGERLELNAGLAGARLRGASGRMYAGRGWRALSPEAGPRRAVPRRIERADARDGAALRSVRARLEREEHVASVARLSPAAAELHVCASLVRGMRGGQRARQLQCRTAAPRRRRGCVRTIQPTRAFAVFEYSHQPLLLVVPYQYIVIIITTMPDAVFCVIVLAVGAAYRMAAHLEVHRIEADKKKQT